MADESFRVESTPQACKWRRGNAKAEREILVVDYWHVECASNGMRGAATEYSGMILTYGCIEVLPRLNQSYSLRNPLYLPM